ncbi:MAG: RecX family transcriptional regulator [Dehalococcoidales bacterium]|nr:RecX family transcriptional regulator [Dehalococcoidales bacterium]
MREITALHSRKDRGGRVNIFLDGKYAFSLAAEVVAQEGLQVKQALSADRIEALTGADRRQRCLNAALHYLSYRPRSESELREKLRQRGFTEDTRETVISRLKTQGLGDDMAFAQFWKDNRETFNPRSRRLTVMELRRKGIADDIINQVIDTIDDEESAYQAALSRVYRLPQSDYQGFSRRLGGFLKRRGFDYEVINHTVKRLWQETSDNSL